MAVRGTQSLVYMMGECWRRPSLLAIELAWRWGFGIPALALLGYEGQKIVAALPLCETGILDASLQDPLDAMQRISESATLLSPPIHAVMLWLLPLLGIAWAIASGLGRSLVLKRLDPQMHFAPLSLIALQLLRVTALAAAIAGWWRGLQWAADTTLNHGPGNLVAYFAWAIVLSLGAFCLWALLSWIFSIAPMIAMLEGTGIFGSLARSFRLGPLTGKLVEVNMVLGIIKLALVVLAMVFSAIPLPFAPDMTGEPLYLWLAGVTLLYFAASDFFQVARLGVFIQLWRHHMTADSSPRPIFDQPR